MDTARSKVLVLAGRQTVSVVSSTSSALQLDCHPVSTRAEALSMLQSHNISCLVAALGTTTENQLFDLPGLRSSLVSTAQQLSVPVIVFSYAACSDPGREKACTAAGAKAVICDRDALFTLLKELPGATLTNEPMPLLSPATSLTSRTGPPTLLVLAGRQSTAVAAAVATELGLACFAARARGEALEALNTINVVFVVAALGTAPENYLFDMRGYRSSLINAAKKLAVPVGVYSYTVCGNADTTKACMAAGALGVVCNRAALLDLIRPLHTASHAQVHTTALSTLPDDTLTVLVLAGRKTTATVSAIATSLNLTVHAVNTRAAACEVLCSKPVTLVVSALGTTTENFLLDQTGSRSTLIAEARVQSVPVVVFSHSACARKEMEGACYAAGAKGVVCEGEAFKQLLLEVLGAIHAEAASQASTNPEDEPLPTLQTLSLQPSVTLPNQQAPIPDPMPLHPPASSSSETRPSILVLAGSKTISIVSSVAAEMHMICYQATTTLAALATLHHNPVTFVVAALGTSNSNVLFDQGGDRSSLIEASTKKGVPVIVFSHTACGNADHARACYDAGAMAIICDRKSLQELVRDALEDVSTSSHSPSMIPDLFLDDGGNLVMGDLSLSHATCTAEAEAAAAKSRPTPGMISAVSIAPPNSSQALAVAATLPPSTTVNMPAASTAAVQMPTPPVVQPTTTPSQAATSAGEATKLSTPSVTAPQNTEIPALPPATSTISTPIAEVSTLQVDLYPPVQRRLQVLKALEEAQADAKEVHRYKKTTERIKDMVSSILPLATLPPSPSRVRFVVISDTHANHRSVSLPAGDVLLHCGDMVGNYGDHCDIASQVMDVANWLGSLPFKRVFLIPGNHDTILDPLGHPEHTRVREAFIKALAPHVTLLDGSGGQYRGLKIWGSPVVTCRVEKYGQRYYSNGFERTRAVRTVLWSSIPDNLDVMITHTPPVGDAGDELLLERLITMRGAPKVHVWGHDHRNFGCGPGLVSGQLMWFNAAQNNMLGHEPGCGGQPWVFDLPATE